MRILACAMMLLLFGGCEPGPPSVDVAGEKLVGKYVEDDRVAAFLGVPFAQPPVDELRWRAPQPITTRVATRDASAFAPACMQTMRILDWYRYLAELFGGSADYYDDLEVSEDCLYLNVWTTTVKNDAKLPVMVWIHGGSNKSGWSYEPNYHGNQLAQKGVVVVSVAYRQGVFGFFSHPDLPTEEPVANFAYWDLLAALEWIQANIHQFGGDPERVTLFGESAGGQNIIELMFADRAAGLFHRAIVQSPPLVNMTNPSSLDAERRRARELAAALELPTGALDELRAVPADVLLETYDETFPDHYHVAAIDDQLLTRSSWEALEAGDIPRMPLIIGTNDHEWYDSIPDGTGWDVVANPPRPLLHLDLDAALVVVKEEDDPKRALDRLITADRYLCKSQYLANRKNQFVGEAWLYHFTRVREDEAAIRELGAYHGAEYPYVFGTHDRYMTTTGTDRALAEVMQNYWVAFAATGNPNSDATPQWPLFTGANPLAQELGDSVFPKSAPEPQLCALFEKWRATKYGGRSD